MLSSLRLSAAFLVLFSTAAFAEGDPVKGEKEFKKCKACHAVGDDAKNKVGPMLNGIVGATAAQNADFKYSKAMIAKGEEGLVWDEANLAEYLKKPKAFIKGTKMAFGGIKKEEKVADLIAYLKTFE